MRISLMAMTLFLLFMPSAGHSENDLNLVGEGDVRYLGFIKVYKAQLYANTSSIEPDILNPSVSKCLNLTYSVSLVPENFIEGAETILQRQHSPALIHEYKDQLERLHAAYKPVDEGDQYRLCYDSIQKTTRLLLNGEELAAITSADFSSLYFGIWLGKKAPIDEGLRDNLLAAYQAGARHE